MQYIIEIFLVFLYESYITMYHQYVKDVRIPKVLVHNFKFYLWVVLVAHTIFIFEYHFFRKVIFAAFNRGICNNVL